MPSVQGQSVQGQGVDLEFIQGKLAVGVEARELVSSLKRLGGRGRLSCHYEDDVGDATVAGVAQLLRVQQAPVAVGEAYHDRLRVVERGAPVV